VLKKAVGGGGFALSHSLFHRIPGGRNIDAETHAGVSEAHQRSRADQARHRRGGDRGVRLAIAARTRTSKRMIYYYFGGKEQLYLAVLAEAYRSIRTLESQLDIDSCDAREALRRLIEATFDHDEQNPNFIRLVSIENIHHGKHLKQHPELRRLNASVIATLDRILQRGRKEGVFRADVDPVDLHLAISSYCFFRVANRHSFGALFDRDLSEPKIRARSRQQIVDMILAWLSVAKA
jgi:AcrR family transcriptional regulator